MRRVIPTLQVRATAVVRRGDDIVLVRQRVRHDRDWSLPGGRVGLGEALRDACTREVLEETGLLVRVERLLNLCEEPSFSPLLLHVTFQCTPEAGELRLPSNELEENPISDVRWVPVAQLGDFPLGRELGAGPVRVPVLQLEPGHRSHVSVYRVMVT